MSSQTFKEIQGHISEDSQGLDMKKTGRWTLEEDDILRSVVPYYGGRHWRKIAEHVPGRTSIQCLHRWTKILQPGLVKGPWSVQEDQALKDFVEKHGTEKWSQAAQIIPGRNGKQCRERWFNTLSPDVKKGNWTKKEDEIIFQLYNEIGPKWSQISKQMEGRTENAIKNRFYSTLRRLDLSNKQKESQEAFKVKNKRQSDSQILNTVKNQKKAKKETAQIVDLSTKIQYHTEEQEQICSQSSQTRSSAIINSENQSLIQTQKVQPENESCEQNQDEKQTSQQYFEQSSAKTVNQEKAQTNENIIITEIKDKRRKSETQGLQNADLSKNTLSLLQEQAKNKFDSLKRITEIKDKYKHKSLESQLLAQQQTELSQYQQQQQLAYVNNQSQHHYNDLEYLNQIETQQDSLPLSFQSNNQCQMRYDCQNQELYNQHNQQQMSHVQRSQYSNTIPQNHISNMVARENMPDQIECCQLSNNQSQYLQNQHQIHTQLQKHQQIENCLLEQQQLLQQQNINSEEEEQRVMQLLQRVSQLENLLSSARKELMILETNSQKYKQ